MNVPDHLHVEEVDKHVLTPEEVSSVLTHPARKIMIMKALALLNDAN